MIQRLFLPSTPRVRARQCQILILAALLLSFGLGWQIGRLIPTARPWTLEHLRLLDISPAPNPIADLTAIFTRPAGNRCEIRLDFLDLPDPMEYALTLTLLPPAPDKATTFELTSTLPPPPGVRIQADSVTDILTLSLADCRPTAETRLRVQTEHETLETTFKAPTAYQPLPLQFVFYNTFWPAATPIQAWRRWDGAHTGPRGERHGLRGLLDAAEANRIPLTLHDTTSPFVLSALEAVGGLERITRLESAGLLARPAGPPPSSGFLDFELNRDGLSLPARQQLLFALFSSASSLPHSLPPLPQGEGDGTSASPSASYPLLIGGDFQRSMWGTCEYAHPAFAWLQARPYFHIVPVTPIPTPVSLPPDALTTAQHTLAQADPALAQNYGWMLPVLQAAARWAERPAPAAECQNDLCILASERFYAVFDPLGGRLVFLFTGREQLTAPSAQFFLGLSDRSLWDVSRGQAADPAQIMGAFGDADAPFRPYQAEVSSDGLRFRSREGREKTYRLTETGLEARFSPPLETRIPLALSPQIRFQPRWPQRYRLKRENNTLRLKAEGGASLMLHVTEGMLHGVDSSLVAIPFLAAPEDPNRELSPDFFLPFPLTVVHVSASRLTLKALP